MSDGGVEVGGRDATDAAGALATGGAPTAGIAKPPAVGAVELRGAGAPSGGIVKPPGGAGVDDAAIRWPIRLRPGLAAA